MGVKIIWTVFQIFKIKDDYTCYRFVIKAANYRL